MRMNAKTENKANFRANEPSVMIGRSQPRFHKVKYEWNGREKGKGKRFAQNCAVSSLREKLASEANGFLVCSSFVFQKVEVSLCVFPLALPLSFSSWPSSSVFALALSLAFIRGSQWGGGFYGYRLKVWLFYGYRLIIFSYG